jgi:hypothetical protein
VYAVGVKISRLFTPQFLIPVYACTHVITLA